jgi:hypothetical protein
MVPTIRATTSDRLGTPSETQQSQILDHRPIRLPLSTVALPRDQAGRKCPKLYPVASSVVEIRAPPNGGASSRLMFKPTFPGFPVVVGAGSPVGASWATVNERRVRRRRSKQPGDCAEALELVATRYKIRRDHESGTDAVRRLGSRKPVVQACLRQASLRGRPVGRRGQKSRVRAGVHRTRKSSRFTGRLVPRTPLAPGGGRL